MNFTISGGERGVLLSEARKTIAAAFEGGGPGHERQAERARAPAGGRSALSAPCGAFVTIHKQGAAGKWELRGCIGRMSASAPLEETVRAMALEAAFGDPRFPPLKQEELPFCRIEISVLSPMEACDDPRKIRVGFHGLLLTKGGRSGVLLPQVPVEQGWDLDEYLDYICVKAGLPPRSYEAADAKLYTFTAVVFGEQDSQPGKTRHA
jgi:AmmeMemoRadiSam system protein A